ncbi:MAG: ABC transporter substrate-binding protein [Deltaproteobacteria bacterium]|nr:ABC transporter substrate-binding protein [Deltaproteobacteria bacterium]
MKRMILTAVFLVLLAAPFAWGADRIRIGYSSISGGYVGLWVARDAGLFAREGLDEQMILIPSGSQLAQVAVAGEVDIASLNGSSAMAAALQGADIKLIGSQVNKMIFSVHVRPGIKSIEELKGKKIGVTRFGSSTDISARYALRKHNLQPEKDVAILQMGAMTSIAAGLKGGSIDGGVVSPPTNFALEKLGFKELISVTDLEIPFPSPSLAAQGGVIRSKPGVIDRFMRAYARGIHRARTDKELALKSMARYTKIEDLFVLQRAYDLFVGKVLEKAPYIEIAAMRTALDDLARTTPAAKNAKAEQFIDLRFLDNLEKSGLLKELYR